MAKDAVAKDAVTKDERELWLKARNGDREALDGLLRMHQRNVYRFGLRMCGDEEAAKEVLQNTLLTAFEKVGTFRGDSRISTWLYSIARSFCSRHHRRTRSAPMHDVSLDVPGAGAHFASEEPSPVDQSEKAQMAELVATAIATLPDSHREVVLLRDVEGLSAEEAAEILELQVPALKSRLHRGRQQLKQTLAVLLRDSGGALDGAPPCPRLAEALADIDGREIDQAACAAIEKHLGECPGCAERLGDLQAAASLCKRLPHGDVPDAVQRAVRVALAEALGPAAL